MTVSSSRRRREFDAHGSLHLTREHPSALVGAQYEGLAAAANLVPASCIDADIVDHARRDTEEAFIAPRADVVEPDGCADQLLEAIRT